MPGKIFFRIVSISFGTWPKLTFLATLAGGFFVRSLGQIIGGLGLPETPETVLVGIPPVVAQRLH
jgi:hypothetical protein